MTVLPLPDVLYRATSILIVVLAIGLVAVHSVLAALAAERAGLPRATMPAVVGAVLALWLAAGFTVADPSRIGAWSNTTRLVVALGVGFGPLLAAGALLFGSATLRTLYTSMPATWLIRAQTYRVAGLMFLFPFLYYGIVPAGFAVPAALGDFLTGAFAPVVARVVSERRPHALAWATAWNLFGILDLIVAPVAAGLSHANVLGIYPLALVPLFVGPPLGILTHIYSLRNLAAHATGEPRRVATRAFAPASS